MILWITGNSKAGKTTLAKWLLELHPKAVWLDGDIVRTVWPGLGFSENDRVENNMRVARLADVLNKQGHTIIVSTICPFASLRNKIRELIGKDVNFVYLSGGKPVTEEYPYEERQKSENNFDI